VLEAGASTRSKTPLKDRLLLRQARFAGTGHYEVELALKKEDPINFELLYTKLVQIVFNAHEVARLVSASPMTRELGEVIFGLYTPEGDAICLSHGLLVHVHTVSRMIKWMLANDYEEKVGFKAGDIFFNNDPYIGGAHALDQMIVIPIFWEGEIIGWAAGLTHVPETGAAQPGGYGAWFRTRFEEGLFMPCVRIGEHDTFNHDIEVMVDRSTRTSVWWHTDNRAKFTGARMIREEVQRLVASIGRERYAQAASEYIEDSLRAARERVRRLLRPGRYREVGWRGTIIPGEEMLLHAPLEMTVRENGSLVLDWEGLSSAGWQPFQGSLPCMEGLVLNGLIQHVLFDARHNEGTLLIVDLRVPPGTCCNPDNILYPTTLWGPAYAAGVATSQALSRAYYAGGYLEEVHASSALSSGYTAGGKDQYGRPLGAHNMEFAAAGMPAQARMDGLDTSGVEFNPEGDMGDAEIWEQTLPPLYLSRGPRIDGGGFGKYRGGNGIQSWYAMPDVPDLEIGSFGSAPIFSAPGLMGGYPASALLMWVGHDTRLKEYAEKGLSLPACEGDDVANPAFKQELGGRWEAVIGSNYPATRLKPYDIFTAVSGDGGGFGDPIERDPEAVAADVRRGHTSKRAAREVYAVALQADGMVDGPQTEALRQRRREQRRKDGIPASEYRARMRERVQRGEFAPPVKRMYLDVLRKSAKFAREFRTFWNLPEDWTMPDETKE